MLEHIIQGPHNLIGSNEDIEALASKDMARLLVISDSHGHTTLLKNIVLNFGKECDALIFCGDGIGDLIHLIGDTKNDKTIQECTPPVIAFVCGNGDPSTYPLDAEKSISIPNSQTLVVNGKKLMIVHGHFQGVDFGMENLGLEMQLADCKAAFYGHTHIAREEYLNDYRFINPGSCARPRGGQPSGFAIATVGKNFIDMAFIKIVSSLDGNQTYTGWTPIY